MGVVRRTVERIEHPARPRRNGQAGIELFGQHVMIGEAFGDEVAEHPLDREVDLGHEIDGALLLDVNIAAEARHLDLASANDRLDGGGQKQRGGSHSALEGVTGRFRGMQPFDHPDFHAAFRRPRQAHLVHETANEKDPPAAGLEQVIGFEGIGDRLGIEAFSLIPDTNRQAGHLAGRRPLEFDKYVLRLVIAVAVPDGIDHRFADRHADPVNRLVIETERPPDVIAHDLDEIHHFERAGEFEPNYL
jgi:hypothetical protein